MKKEDSIRQYIDKYLEGKKESAREAFLQKPIERQYAAIMAWRYRKLKKHNNVGKSSEALEIINLLQAARKKLSAFPSLTEEDMKAISLAKEEFTDTFKVMELHRKEKEIADLEKQQQEIALRIERLRNYKN